MRSRIISYQTTRNLTLSLPVTRSAGHMTYLFWRGI